MAAYLCRAGWVIVLLGTGEIRAAISRSGGAATTEIGITPQDNYEQWKSALDTGKGVPPPTFTILPGFEVEQVRVARPEEGSWIALAFDPAGRAVIARERRGLLRLTLPPAVARVEVIDDTLDEVRGLLFAFGALYANANVSRGLFRLRSSDGADRFDEIRPLLSTKAGGHGRNAVALGPDGGIAMIAGDSVDLPAGTVRLTPPLVAGLFPGDNLPHGHLLRSDAAGKSPTLVASGLRNPVGLDFNADGEAFTYDADAETDMGTPWYRPTQVRHLVSGADFGWRRVTGHWPPYYPDEVDNPPATLVIGKGSPTAVKFGTRSRFPPPYQRALYMLDWAYGRILAVHLTPQGASYAGRAETFLRGRPLNVTGLDFGLDGAMYFVTGGRATQSALYRVRHVGPSAAAVPLTAEEVVRAGQAVAARELRRRLEAFHGRHDPGAIDAAWTLVDHSDPWIAHAARVAIEHQPLESWAARALAEPLVARALPLLMALTRVAPDNFLPGVVERLARLNPGSLPSAQVMVYLRAAELATQRLELNDPSRPKKLIALIAPLVPNASPEVSRKAGGLLLRLNAPGAVTKATALLVAASAQEDKLHYLQLLGRARSGWTQETRGRYFRVLAGAGTFRGGAGLPKFLQEIKTEALAGVPVDERARYAAMLEPVRVPALPTVPADAVRSLVQEWTMARFEGVLAKAGGGRDLQRGKRIFAAAGCVLCHQLGDEGRPVGPDLTDVAGRFSRRDILESILEPSKVVSETYRNVVVTTRQGETVTGRVAPADFRLPVLRLVTNPFEPEKTVDVAKDEIVSYVESEISPMPKGLLDRFTEEEILDLIAYLEAGGDSGRRNVAP